MSTTVLRMAQAPVGEASRRKAEEPPLSIVSPLVLAVLVLVLGLYVPPALSGLIAEAAQTLG
jgi:formate hydrogenlyase subunit 3/multisubunit Na+/H+ antiporter MnhD subunit